MKLALCQMMVGMNKEDNLEKACTMVREAAAEGADIIALPEMFNCPYSNKYFRAYGEEAQGNTVKTLSELAAELGIYLVGGSIPELKDGNVYNSSFIFNRKEI